MTVTPLNPPPPPAPVADVIAGAGTPITLATGAPVELRYTFQSLRAMESRFGSIVGVAPQIKQAAAALKDAKADLDSDSTEYAARQAALFTVLSDVLAQGLLHVRVRHPDTGLVVRLGEATDVLFEQLDPARLTEYVNAFGVALGMAFGDVGKAEGATQTPAFPGTTGTTSGPSSSGEATGSSGA
jgi:hypothetical protein